MPPGLSVIVPVLNEAAGIAAHLEALQTIRGQGVEVVVVDGGSEDETMAIARPLVDLVVVSRRGRGVQMNAGARAARGEILLFLHADTHLPDGAPQTVQAALAGCRHTWGRFDVEIEGQHPVLHLVALGMNWRSRLTGIATGDQAIFVRRELFEAVGAFQELALMEDIALSKTLKRIAPPACLRDRVVTSGRRWEKRGVFRTILTMWLLRLGYWLGGNPARLARWYA